MQMSNDSQSNNFNYSHDRSNAEHGGFGPDRVMWYSSASSDGLITPMMVPDSGRTTLKDNRSITRVFGLHPFVCIWRLITMCFAFGVPWPFIEGHCCATAPPANRQLMDGLFLAQPPPTTRQCYGCSRYTSKLRSLVTISSNSRALPSLN